MNKDEYLNALFSVVEIYDEILMRLNILKMKDNLTKDILLEIINFYNYIANIREDVFEIISNESAKNVTYNTNMVFFVEQLKNTESYYKDIAQQGIKEFYF